MSKFTEKYFTMTEQDVVEYAKTVLKFFPEEARIKCTEIGDGNLNYVFRLVDEDTKRSIIIKQSGPVARISSEFVVSPDRNRIESEILKHQWKLAPGLVPEVYSYDPIMNCTAMEDLSDYEIMRKALMQYKVFPKFADHITTFLVNTLLLSSDVVMEHKEKKELMRNFINPELCEISEDLVYTEPFYDCPRNDIFPETRPFVEENIWNDKRLQLETAKLKFEFMTNAQSLIHGDLHTGSIFVKEDSTKVFDPEFAFYGPAGYDVGNVIANLMFAYEHAKQTIEDEKGRANYLDYLKKTIAEVIDLFKVKFMKVWDEHVTEITAKYEGFKEYYLDLIMRDTAAVTGLELTRRIIGLAGVKDLTSITDPKKRTEAERTLLSSAKEFILERASFKSGKDYIDVLEKFEKQFQGM